MSKTEVQFSWDWKQQPNVPKILQATKKYLMKRANFQTVTMLIPNRILMQSYCQLINMIMLNKYIIYGIIYGLRRIVVRRNLKGLKKKMVTSKKNNKNGK